MRLTNLLIASSFLLAPITASAQEAEATVSGPTAAIGIDYTNEYWFRGVIQQTEGLILQPYGEAGFTLVEGDAVSVGLSTGIWASAHSEGQDTDTAPGSWYEADIYAGLSFGLPGNVGLDVTYTAYTSPNGSFGTVHELGVGLSYDDSGLFEDIAFFGGVAPSITVARELDGQADGGDSLGTYAEIGLEPSFTLSDSENFPISASLPIAAGLSLGDYYEFNGTDSTFGFMSAGVSLGFGLGFMPSNLGSWDLSVGASVLQLGENAEAIAGDDGATKFIASAGLAIGY